jgi:hypothetical protein
MMHKLAHVHIGAIGADAHNAHTPIGCACASPCARTEHGALAYADSLSPKSAHP